jgi:hypothetical protein
MDTKEYIVTLRKGVDIASFYQDMESLNKDQTVPERAVECANRRPLSRNTHYLLTDDEAEKLRQDPRVLAVELPPEDLGLSIKPLMFMKELELLKDLVVDHSASLLTAYSPSTTAYDSQDPGSLTYNKSNTVSQSHLNWGIRRCTLDSQITGWGSDGTTNVSAVITLEAIGRNVDVVVVDEGNPDPNHPEFAVNYDGTGGTRMVSYDWYDLDPIVRGTPKVAPYSAPNADHATHVTGTVAGNRQGWARAANIYNISYADVTSSFLFDYVRAFHETKPINPVTGLKNPTIVNNSWGFFLIAANWSASNVSQVVHRGTTYTGPFTSGQIANYGILTGEDIPVPVASINADIEDAIDAGIIFVGAAGNSSWKHDVPGGIDWDNRAIINGNPYFYHQGGTPTGSTSTLENITVGSTNLLQTETKADFSDCGPGVDIYAPGFFIMSTVTSSMSVKVPDARNTSYFLSKMAGTSMASPQVCGVIACYLELYPRWNQADAKEFILAYARSNQLTGTNGGYADVTDLQGGPNVFLKYPRLVPSEGVVQPTPLYGLRPVSGQTFPRPRIFRYGT